MRRLFAGTTIALSGMFCLTVVAIIIARQAQPMAPTGDTAVIESYTRMAGEGRLLVGPYSRFQWHHPGPIYFYALSPFYAASGHRTAGLNAAAVAINLSLLAVSVLIAATSGGPILAVTVATASAFFVFRLPELLTSTWNPHIVLFPFVATALLCAAAAAGRVWLLPIAALTASFVAQTAVGVLPAAVLLGAASFGAISSAALRDGASRRRFAAVIATTAAVAALAWTLPLVEQATHSPGNLAALWNFFAGGGGKGITGQPLRAAFAAWAVMLSGLARPEFYLAHGWTLRLNHSGWAEAWAAAQMVLLVCAAVLSIRAGRRFQLYLSAFLFASSLLALWSVTRIEGDIMDHEIFWISGLGLLNTAVVADAIISAVVPRRLLSGTSSGRATIACGVLVMLCGAVGLSQLNAIRGRSLAPSVETTAIQNVARDIQVYLQREGVERPLIKIDQDSWGLAAGVLLQMQKSGVSYAVDEDWLPMFTEAARATGQESAVLSISGATRHVILRGRPGVVAVAESGPVFADALPSAAGGRPR